MESVINKDPVCGMDVEPERAAASTNLLIPPHRFINDSMLEIGVHTTEI